MDTSNADKSYYRNPGIRGLLRNSDGSWISGFIRNIGIASSFATELWDVRDGLLLAKKHNIQNINIELDAKALIDLLLSDNYIYVRSHPLSALIINCRLLIQSFETSHSSRMKFLFGSFGKRREQSFKFLW